MYACLVHKLCVNKHLYRGLSTNHISHHFKKPFDHFKILRHKLNQPSAYQSLVNTMSLSSAGGNRFPQI